jgi:hypothetical protein
VGAARDWPRHFLHLGGLVLDDERLRPFLETQRK